MINLIGQNLHNGKYLIDRELGRGNFGITYKATNLGLERDVAIKMLDPYLRPDPNMNDWVAQFQDEARRLAKCSHPNIVPVLDFFCEGGRPCIVMEYIRGQTLDLIVGDNNPLSETTAVEYIRQIGAALGAIHEQFLLHQDVKPKNLILSQDSQQVVLIDFGIAREFSAQQLQYQTPNQRNLLSEGYAPLEQYIVDSPRTIATDIYGLAATLYTLLTGKIPLSAISRVHGCTLDPPRKIRPELSDTVSEAVMWGMALETDCRPNCLSEWLTELTTNSNETCSLKTSASLKVINPVTNLPINTRELNQLVERKIPIMGATYLKKTAILIGAAMLGLGTVMTFASSNSNLQTGQAKDKNSPLTSDSSQVTPESSQLLPNKSIEPIADQKKSIDLESSSSQESGDRSEPETNMDVEQSTKMTNQVIESQPKVEVNIPSKQVTPAPMPNDSSSTPQLFLQNKTSNSNISQPAIFGSGKTNPENQVENQPQPQIFSNSSSTHVIKRQPQILLHRVHNKKSQNMRLIQKSRRNRLSNLKPKVKKQHSRIFR